ALGARRSALGARRSALGARRSALGARRSALGARRSALGARRSALGARRVFTKVRGGMFTTGGPHPSTAHRRRSPPSQVGERRRFYSIEAEAVSWLYLTADGSAAAAHDLHARLSDTAEFRSPRDRRHRTAFPQHRVHIAALLR
ncbi:hypothetical protein ACFYW8_39035, partial [Streptomyces sp. NPDC002742]|uniref:hypothetical protein n=1 Tax=Streptomyces sp. NPDC002742 TaxID=3364663 RepID=UPI0036977A8F